MDYNTSDIELFMSLFHGLENIRYNNYLLSWVEKQQSWGKYDFNLEQIKVDFPNVSEKALYLALSRLSSYGTKNERS